MPLICPDLLLQIVCLLTVFLDNFSFAILGPVMPFYLHPSGIWLGMLMAIFFFTNFLTSPIIGQISDRVGRPVCICVALAGAVVMLFLTGLSRSLVVLLIFRALSGIFASYTAVCQALLSDLVSPVNRARWMGFYGAAFGLGFVLGPGFGGLLAGSIDPKHDVSAHEWQSICFIAGGVNAANFILTTLIFVSVALYKRHRAKTSPAVELQHRLLESEEGSCREDLSPAAASPEGVPTSPSQDGKEPTADAATDTDTAAADPPAKPRFLVNLRTALKSPAVVVLWIALFCIMVALMAVQSTIALVLREVFHQHPDFLGVLLFAVGVALVITQIFVQFLVRCLRPTIVAFIGSCILAGCLMGIAFVRVLGLVFAFAVLCGLAQGLAQPTVLALFSLHGTPEIKGVLMGLCQASICLARSVGPLLHGALFDANASVPYIVGAFLGLAGGVILMLGPKQPVPERKT